MLQGKTVQKFHGDERAPTVFGNFVDGADVGMIQRRGGPGFTAKSLEHLWIFRDGVRKKFQCDKPAERRILGLVDNTHSATAEFLDDAIVRNVLTNERIGAGHAQHILERTRNQVNEGTSSHFTERLQVLLDEAGT